MDEPAGPSWGPARWVGPAALLAALAALAWTLWGRAPEDRVVAAVLAVVCAVAGLALLRIRVRLRVSSEGIVVTGPLHRREIAWSQISTISTPRRGRFGRRAALLELEIRPGDEAAARRDPGGGGRPGDRGGPEDGSGDRDGSGGPDDGSDDPEDELLTFGRFDLGADPAEVRRALLRHRR